MKRSLPNLEYLCSIELSHNILIINKYKITDVHSWRVNMVLAIVILVQLQLYIN